ncbi:MAG: ABC transporter substrate-binding protein [Planctomycetota bacterium]
MSGLIELSLLCRMAAGHREGEGRYRARAAALASVVLLSFVVCSGCGGEEAERPAAVNPPGLFERARDPAQVAWGERLRRRLRDGPETLHPLLLRSDSEQDLMGLLNDSLWNVGPDLEPVVTGHLVERTEISPDHKVVTVKLRPGNSWHDGHPFTARDVAFSFRALRDERVPAMHRVDGVAAVEALDDFTVRYTLDEPTPALYWQLTFRLVPEHIMAAELEADPTQSRLARQPVGLGPYRLLEWRSDELLRLERWEGYRGKWPAFKEVLYRIVPDGSVALELFRAGEIDEMELSGDQWRALESDARFAEVGVRYMADEATLTFICWNTKDPLFSDARVRRAMTMALDIEGFIRSYYHGLCRRSLGPWAEGTWMYNSDVRPLPFDPEGAARLLAEAGFSEDATTGVRRRESDGLEFRFTLLGPQESKGFAELAQVFQHSLRSIGVELELQLLEFATLLERASQHEFQALGLAMGTAADPMYIENRFGTDGGRNYGCYSNPELDSLLEKGRTTFDREARARVYREMQALLYEEQPFTFVFFRSSLWAFHKRLRGLSSSPAGPVDHYPGNLAWWVKEGEQLFGERMTFTELCERTDLPIATWCAGHGGDDRGGGDRGK